MLYHRRYPIVFWTVFFLFAVFAVLWFYSCNRFFVLHYHEQIQLFRFDRLYFHSYLSLPGGISGYLGSFLTQFYYYPVAGSIIISCALTAVYLLFYLIGQISGNIGRLFFMPFIPSVLLMMSFVNINFDMSSALGLIFVLSAFRWYISLSLPTRYYAGCILVIAIYFIAGGNALLLSALMLIFELTDTNKFFGDQQAKIDQQPKKRLILKYSYLVGLFILTVLLPWLARYLFYTVTLREAYFALTPGNFLFPTLINKILWFSFPVLYLIWRLLAAKTEHWNLKSWKIIACNCLLMISLTVWGSNSAYDSKAEMLNQMIFDTQNDNWESVLDLGKSYQSKNRLVCYLTNIALAESGQMPYQMFHYTQVGTIGLFLDWELSYFAVCYLGEIYYRLGMIPEAEHCAFEATVASPKEPNTQTLRRLATTNIIRRDSVAACKYIRYFENSPIYRKWAQQQREYLSRAMADTAFFVPNAPVPVRHDDFFINYQYPDNTLLLLLQADPKHRMAFEYLMAYYMLQKDLEQMKLCIDFYYENFDYPDIPIHYEEALIAYQNSTQAGQEFFEKYPVSQVTRERFTQYIKAFKAAQGSVRNFEQLQKQFGNTYWYYVHFVEPSTLQKKDEKNRY